jgi:hypothetical protein
VSGLVAGCSGSDDEPKASATKTTSAAPATTTPAPAPTPAAQPEGADGVTYEIRNWDEYASEPAVLAWKQVQEALGASTNQGRIIPALRDGSSKKALRKFVAAVDYSSRNKLHVPDRGIARVEKADVGSTSATLTTCLWAPSISVYDEADQIVGGESEYWYKQEVTLKSRSGRWIVASQLTEGKCSGGAPA